VKFLEEFSIVVGQGSRSLGLGRLSFWNFVGLLPVGKLVKALRVARKGAFIFRAKKGDGRHFAERLGESFGFMVAFSIVDLAAMKVIRMHNINESHLFLGRRSWFSSKGKTSFVVVYHDASRAGKHLDVHFGNGTSFIVRVSGKPVESKIKFNRDGHLTETSKKELIAFLREEISNRSRVPQNIDHSKSEASFEFFNGSLSQGYGSGFTRQKVLEGDALIMKISGGKGETAEMYIPQLDPDNTIYIHKLYDGKTPIAVWGFKTNPDVRFEDRLHLKLIDTVSEFEKKIDPATITKKYDGASCYVWTTKKGTRIYSPRISKTTGRRIEYTPKVWELADVSSEKEIKAMGELLFRKKYFGIIPGGYIPAHEIGGILNSNSLRPDNVQPEIRLYRVDKYGNLKLYDAPFFENRKFQEKVALLKPDILKVVELTDIDDRSMEGLVATGFGDSIINGFKIKWREDLFDWIVEDIDFRITDKGAIAGVMWCRSLESGKRFKLGPGQVGNYDTVLDIMENKDQYIGRVAKVAGFKGHEGRAAKLVDWHLDK